MQLLAVLYGREVELLLSIQLLGFLPPTILGLASFLHLQYATHIVQAAAKL